MKQVLWSSQTHSAMAVVRDTVVELRELSMCQISSDSYLPQRRCLSVLLGRLKLLAPFFEEVLDSNPPLPPSSVMAFRELHSVVQKVKALVTGCVQASVTASLLGHGSGSTVVQEVNKGMAGALDALPLNLLEISEEVKEQVLLLRRQAKRCKVDPVEEGFRIETHDLLLKFKNGSIEAHTDRLGKLFHYLGFASFDECRTELSRLRKEIRAKLTAGDVSAVEDLRSLASFVRFSSRILYGSVSRLEDDDEDDEFVVCEEDRAAEAEAGEADVEAASDNILPDEFRCPISLEMMKDPVIIATGQTYERESIQKWIWGGRSTCPKSGQRLIHLSLIPNYALRSLIRHWCQERKVMIGSLSRDDEEISRAAAGNRLDCSKENLEVVKTTAAFLVGKLATGSPDVQRQVAFELRLLAKIGMENRVCIAEAGAIPFLIPLLSSRDPRTQEDSVTALLNLSIYDNNKRLIMSASALDPILNVLATGWSMEAKQNAAATIFSLASLDEYKVAIGVKPRAISSLVGLLRNESSIQGKKDAINALFNLMLYPLNRPRVVVADGVQPLVDMLCKSELVDEALATLALVAECEQGAKAISQGNGIPMLITLLTGVSPPSTPKVKENSLSVLLALCKNGGGPIKETIACQVETLSSVQELLSLGTPRARRKARSLLKLLDRG